ncbi:MAG: spore cortex biosynthesis protein YabQ [Firmicutes bacterium]|nr:spore cortex biosynthesis protein YabQ [Bacillota bacterium]
METLNSQITAFLATIIVGVMIGIFFDFYRVFRGFIQPNALGTVFGDLAFWAIATAIAFGALLSTTWGEVRFYVFIGSAMGFFLYRVTVSPGVIGLFLAIFRGVRAGSEFVTATMPRAMRQLAIRERDITRALKRRLAAWRGNMARPGRPAGPEIGGQGRSRRP